MAIKIASWNVEGRLSTYQKRGIRGTPEHILSEIAKLDADIIVLPEAYLNAPADGVNERLTALGYKWHDTDYQDTEHDESVRRWGRPHLRVLYRIPAHDFETKRWGGLRDLLVFTTADPDTGKEVRVAAIHLDDLTEARRLLQVDGLIAFVQESPLPVVLLGDFNAMWHEGRARLLTSRLFHIFVRYFPHGQLWSVASRTSEMAIGTTMERFKKAGLADADAKHRPTVTPKQRELPYAPSIRLIQIDHILASRDLSVGSMKIGRDGGSDHRAISAIITTE